MWRNIPIFAGLLLGLGVPGWSDPVDPTQQLGITTDATWYIEQLGVENVIIYDVTEQVYGEDYKNYLDPEGRMFMTIVVQCEPDENGIVKLGISRSGLPLPYSSQEIYSREFRETSSKWIPHCKPLLEPKR